MAAVTVAAGRAMRVESHGNENTSKSTLVYNGDPITSPVNELTLPSLIIKMILIIISVGCVENTSSESDLKSRLKNKSNQLTAFTIIR